MKTEQEIREEIERLKHYKTLKDLEANIIMYICGSLDILEWVLGEEE